MAAPRQPRQKTVAWYLEHGWDCAANQLVVRLHGKDLAFFHYPLPASNEWEINIHGHLHRLAAKAPGEPWQRLVSLEENDYRPTNLRKIVEGLHATPPP